MRTEFCQKWAYQRKLPLLIMNSSMLALLSGSLKELKLAHDLIFFSPLLHRWHLRDRHHKQLASVFNLQTLLEKLRMKVEEASLMAAKDAMKESGANAMDYHWMGILTL